MMKRLIAFAALAICFLRSPGQQTNPSNSPTAEEYLKKSNRQKTAAFVLLGGGVALVLTGLAVTIHNWESDSGPALCVVGAALEVSSIPLFIVSGKNKRKAHAASASFKIERTLLTQNKSFYQGVFPAISLRINL